jgi:hypothetical protein
MENKNSINFMLNNELKILEFKKDITMNDLDAISENNLINNTKIYEDNINDNLDTDWKISIKQENNNQNANNNKNKAYKVTKTSFVIIGQKKSDDLKIVNLGSDKINNDNNKEIKKRGRKRERENNNNEAIKQHDKFSDDNLRKKCKNIVLKYALQFINRKIKEKYKNSIGHGKFRKELKVIEQKNKIKSTVNIDKSFLEKNLKDIFSDNITARFKNLSKTHNKVIIESLIDEEDEEKRIYFNKLFNIKFFDCLKYFIENEEIESDIELFKGFKQFSSIKDEVIRKNGKEYADMLLDYLKNFKEKINKKKARKPKKKVEKKENDN